MTYNSSYVSQRQALGEDLTWYEVERAYQQGKTDGFAQGRQNQTIAKPFVETFLDPRFEMQIRHKIEQMNLDREFRNSMIQMVRFTKPPTLWERFKYWLDNPKR